MKEATPTGYSFLNSPTFRGEDEKRGGIGIIYRTVLNLSIVPLDVDTNSLEKVYVTDIRTGMMFISIHREPPYGTSNLKIGDFQKDIDNILDELCVRPNKLILLGDFNIHMNKPYKSDVSKFNISLSSYGCEQHITKPTHRLGNTLDLVITKTDDDVVLDWTVKQEIVSDHFQVYCTINRLKPEIPKIKRSMRNFRNFDQSSFDIKLQETLACADSDNVNDMVLCYTNICNGLLDKYAPVTTKSVSNRCRLPWYTE